VSKEVETNPTTGAADEAESETDTNSKNETSKRNVSYEYTFKVRNTETGVEERKAVCKRFYLSTLSVSDNVIRTAKQNEEKGRGKGDGRGKHKPNHTLKPEVKAAIFEHIESFPVMASHYARKKTSRQYLSCDLNLQKMFEMYEKDVVSRDSAMKVDVSTYRKIFNTEYKLSFHRPKEDLCLLCFKYLHASQETKTAMEGEMQMHLKNKELAREQKEHDKKRAARDSEFKSFTFDLEAVLYSPCSDVSSYHYSRKFCTYNFTVYDQENHDGTCFLWHETEGKRGSDEIGTCLWLQLTSPPPTVKNVSFFSDCCGGQNRNRYAASLFEYAVKNIPELQSIEMNFLESGHTDMEVDSMHSAIGKAKKGHPVYSPTEWPTILRGARRQRPYSVVELGHGNFFDLKDLKEKTIEGGMKKDSEGNTVSWMKVKRLKFLKHEKHILVKTGYDEEDFRILPLEEPTSRTRGKLQGPRRTYELRKKYSSSLPISAAKKRDLMGLCSTGAIPPNYQEFWTTVSDSNRVVDRVPVPDVQDDDETDDDE